MNSIAVFCGARSGADPAFADDARELGRLIAERGSRLVYGGGNVGLMGVIADAALENGGALTGVIPRSMVEIELAHTGVDDMRVVETMLERKQLIAEVSDAFICLPGGVGTLDELFEVVTWNQLRLHDKPVTLINTNGFYDGLWEFLRRAADLGLILPRTMAQISLAESPAHALELLEAYTPV